MAKSKPLTINGSGQPANNALIQPIVQIDSSPASSDPPGPSINEYLAVPALSSYFDFQHCRLLLSRHGATLVKPEPHEDDGFELVSVKEPKRKAPPIASSAAKKMKTEVIDVDLDDDDDKDSKHGIRGEASSSFISTIRLFTTSCSFQLDTSGSQAHSSLAEGKLGEVNLAAGMDVGSFADAPEGGLVVRGLQLDVYSQGCLLASLPIINTHSGEFAPENGCWRSSNGQWLWSAARLAEQRVLSLTTKASLHEGGTTLKLDISGLLGPQAPLWDEVNHSSTSAARLDSRQIIDMIEVLRFASMESDLAAEQIRRVPVDASAIYANLSPAAIGKEETQDIQPLGLEATLLPFQRRSTAFLLGREGKRLNDGQLESVSDRVMTNKGFNELGLWWSQVLERLFFSPIAGAFTAKSSVTRDSDIRGALLAEEMGLGKTVIVLALVMSHPATSTYLDRQAYEDLDNEVMVQPVKATLIVAPELLRQQWIDEISRHAPELNVYSFDGHVKAMKDVPKGQTWSEYAKQFDIIVVSFSTLQKEMGVALKEQPRSRREPRKYERPRCPLIQLEFFRVVCDEIQMVSNTSRAGQVVSMIPRHSSLAVSGTPVQKVDDITSLFKFLRLEGPSTALTKSPNWAPYLFKTLGALATRHLKAGVQSEMLLPLQHRFVVPIDFTAVEEAYYNGIWQQALGILGLDDQGGPLSGTWQLDPTEMRRQLLLLRQACTHPQVAGRATGTGSLAQGNLKSMAEVLLFMKETVAAELFRERDAWLRSAIDGVALRMQDKKAEDRLESAKGTLRELLFRIDDLRDEVLTQLEEAKKIGPGYRFDTAEAAEGSRDSMSNADEDGELLNRGSPEHHRRAHRHTLRQRLRFFTEQKARAAHWLGNVLFQVGELLPEDGALKATLKVEEDNAYDLAEKTRRELLSESQRAIDCSTESTRRAEVKLTLQDLQESLTDFEDAGIQTREAFDQISNCLELLNKNAAVVFEWRKKVKKILYTAVNREVSEENADDDQYAEALDAQHEAEVILEMYRPLLARRQAILTAQVAIGATDAPVGMKDLEAQIKHAKQISRRAHLFGESTASAGEGSDLEVLHETDQIKLKQYRDLNKQMDRVSISTLHRSRSDEQDPLQVLLRELNRVANEGLRREEILLAQTAATKLRQILKRENAHIDALRKELDAFAKLFNSRAGYFRQLQALSDALMDVEVPAGQMSSTITKKQKETDAAWEKMTKMASRLRYLEHLGKMEEAGAADEAKTCIICTDPIRIGVLLSNCGHVTCQACFDSWQQQHRSCPICRTPMGGPQAHHRITYSRALNAKKTEAMDSNDRQSGEDSQNNGLGKKGPLEFNEMPLAEREAVERKVGLGRYGSKLELLVKQLIQISDKGTNEKTIVFSAFSRGLELVADALRQNGIRYVSAATSKLNSAKAIKTFIKDDVDVLLLHSEATSAGLNLMATKHIILLEPLVNSGTERQALGRIHRIGQTKETNVYLYYLRDSVEERILHLAASKGQSVYLKESKTSESSQTEGDSGTLIAKGSSSAKNTREKGDYVNSESDLLSCFFSQHLALPSRQEAGSSSTVGGNAVAGSSSLSRIARPSTRPMTDAERAREARLEAIHRRQMAEEAHQRGQA